MMISLMMSAAFACGIMVGAAVMLIGVVTSDKRAAVRVEE
jgi:hypothetical protein